MSSMKDRNGQFKRYWLHPMSLEHIPIIAGWQEHIGDLSLFDRRTPMPVSADTMESMWRKSIDDGEPRTCNWFVIDDEEDRTVGLAGLQDINYVHGDAVLAILIARSERRKGIALRSSALLLDLGFHQLRLSRITTYYRADNEPSRRLTSECGFQKEGCIRKGWFVGGRHMDVIVIGILADEWRMHRKALNVRLDRDIIVSFRGNTLTNWSWPALEETERVGGKSV